MMPGLQTPEAALTPAVEALGRAAQGLLGQRRPDGVRQGQIDTGASLEAGYILLQLWLNPPEGGQWKPRNPEKLRRAAETILSKLLPDGGVSLYPGGPPDLSASVKAYTALKLAGIPADDSGMAATRERILERGGLDAANGFVRLLLSFFGLYPRARSPLVPPEIALLQKRLLNAFAPWARAIVLPLAVLNSASSTRPVPQSFTLEELTVPDSAASKQHPLLAFWDRIAWKPVRARAIRECERLMLSGTVGGSFTAAMLGLMALDQLGHPADSPARRSLEEELESLIIDDGTRLSVRPFDSHSRDVALVEIARAAARNSQPSHETPDAPPVPEPQSVNEAAMTLLALRSTPVAYASACSVDNRVDVLRDRLLAAQSPSGGWAAFGPELKSALEFTGPFADPACADVTGRVLEALISAGIPHYHPAVTRGVEFLLKTQEADGSWLGRWGVAYTCGTCFALRGLRAARYSDREAAVLRAGEWFRSVQNADGGWGESCAGYEQKTFVASESTPTQTAWAILGLVAGGDAGSLSVRNGIKYLLREQGQGGRWEDRLATSAVGPAGLYFINSVDASAWPVIALAEYTAHTQGAMEKQ